LNETLQLGEDLNLKYMCKISVFETYISLHVNWGEILWLTNVITLLITVTAAAADAHTTRLVASPPCFQKLKMPSSSAPIYTTFLDPETLMTSSIGF